MRNKRPPDDGTLYADENFPGPTVVKLREAGHDVLTARDAGNADREIPDHKVLEFAHGQHRALLTMNRRHFIRLHDENQQHSGIIACTEDKDFVALAQRIHDCLSAAEPLGGRLIRVRRPG